MHILYTFTPKMEKENNFLQWFDEFFETMPHLKDMENSSLKGRKTPEWEKFKPVFFLYMIVNSLDPTQWNVQDNNRVSSTIIIIKRFCFVCGNTKF